MLRTIEAEQILAGSRPLPEPVDGETLASAAGIVVQVRDDGLAAVETLSSQFGDRAVGQPLLIEAPALKNALDRIDPASRSVLERAADRIRLFAEAQRRSITAFETEPADGVACGQVIAPVERAGCYAPGGRYPLPSSVLMTAVTARAAGVGHVLVASPKPTDITLAAAAIAGADALLACGGAHAIAAMAFGAQPLIEPCDAIVGPGNRWVTAAKQLVSGVVRIDMLAGPSELLIIADESADPAIIAADLLAQAEHDTDARANLIAFDAAMIARVNVELESQLESLPTAETAVAAINNSFAVVADSTDAAIELSDRIAPEHLELHTRDAAELAERLKHYGGLFIGTAAAEVLGDYGAGPNHTLPTGGTARSSGGLSVFDFLRIRTYIKAEPGAPGLLPLAADARDLARMESLEAHARSAEHRL